MVFPVLLSGGMNFDISSVIVRHQRCMFASNIDLMTTSECAIVADGESIQEIIMAAKWNRSGHYIFVLWFLLLSIFFFCFSSPNLSDRRLDIYHTSTHGVALVQI